MIKKKGIYIEKIPYGNPFTIVYYDGTYLLIVVNRDGSESVLYKKYSGTTFKDVESGEKTTITEVVNMWCPFGVNYVCKYDDDFPIIDISSILKNEIDANILRLEV